MGYKNKNFNNMIIKGSVTPANIYEQKQKSSSLKFNTSNMTTSFVENKNKFQKWFEMKFSTCPISCFPFKLGHRQSTTSDKVGPAETTQLKNKTTQQPTANSTNKYVDCSDKYLNEYDIFSLGKISANSVIELDVNNNFNKSVKQSDGIKVQTVREDFVKRKKKKTNKSKLSKKLSKKSHADGDVQLQTVTENEEKESAIDLNKSTYTFSSLFGDSSQFAQDEENGQHSSLDCTPFDDDINTSKFDLKRISPDTTEKETGKDSPVTEQTNQLDVSHTTSGSYSIGIDDSYDTFGDSDWESDDVDEDEEADVFGKKDDDEVMDVTYF